MTIIETARITTKGQVTIPNRIRKILHLKQGSSIAFGISKEGIVLMPCETTAQSPYTTQEWKKIEKLAAAQGVAYSTTGDAKSHIKSL